MQAPNDGTKDLIQYAADGVREWHPTTLVVAGTVVMAGWAHNVAFWFGAIAFIAGTGLAVRRQRAYAALREAYAMLQQKSKAEASTNRAALDRRDTVISALCYAELAFLGSQLRYYSSERITLFRPVPGGFTIATRWSANPRFQASHRDFYPAGEGCLGQAWDWGFSEETNLPSPNKELEEWLNVTDSKWKVPRQTAREFTMKSCTYVAIRLQGGTGRELLGVIVFESERTAAELHDNTSPVLEPDKLKRLMTGSAGSRLQLILEQLAALSS